MYDSNKQACCTIKDFLALEQPEQSWSGLSNKFLGMLFGRMDADGDGQLTRDEFIRQADVLRDYIESLGGIGQELIDEIVDSDGSLRSAGAMSNNSAAVMASQSLSRVALLSSTGVAAVKPSAKGFPVSFGHESWELVVNIMRGIQRALDAELATRAVALAALAANRDASAGLSSSLEGLRSELRQEPLSDGAFTRTVEFTLSGTGLSGGGSGGTGGSGSGSAVGGIGAGGGGGGGGGSGAAGGSEQWYFQDYAPEVFARLREHFHVDHESYRYALGSDRLLGNLLLGKLSTLATVGSSGRSGSCFFMSHDGKFFVKTLPAEEDALFRRILKSYYTHMIENPNSLLTRFYGLHRLRKGNGKELCLVVMANLFSNPELTMHEIYDLKGSTVNRDVSVDKNELSLIARKDNNFSRIIRIGSLLKAQMLEQIENDCRFLESFGICDYSLLVGFHFNPPPITPAELDDPELGRETSIFRSYRCGMACMPDDTTSAAQKLTASGGITNSGAGGAVVRRTQQQQQQQQQQTVLLDPLTDTPPQELYFIGVIDVLTCYDIKKKTEHHLKAFIYNKKDISAVPPDDYRIRFLKYVTGILS